MCRSIKKPNNIFFHVSNPINRNSILKRGLLPSLGESQYLQHKISRKRIFLCKNNDYDSTWDDDRYAILLPPHLIKLLRQDKEVYGKKSFYIDNKRIDKKYIKLIYKGTGEDTF